MIGSVLIGEDNLISQQVMEALLEVKCKKVKAVAGYEELREELAKEHYDLLLLDFHLDRDADFIVAQLRAGDSINKDIPVIILSAEPEVVVLEKMRGLTISGYLKKPIDSAQLEAVLSDATVPIVSGASDVLDLSDLEILLGGPERVQRIIKIFVGEATEYFNQMEYLLVKQDWLQLRALVHRARASYGYIGLDHLNNQLTQWEADLDAKRNQDQYQQILHKIKSETSDVLKKLKKAYPFTS
jgi:CheY-like chemotaxis protein